MLTKFIFCNILIFNVNKIKKFILNRLPKTEYVENDQIEGIPTIELLDHLFEQKSFKRTEVENKFNIPRNRYQVLAEKFESLGVLVRGDNNSRVLNEEFSRQDIASMIEGAARADEVKTPFNRTKNKFSYKPMGKQIKERVQEKINQSPILQNEEQEFFKYKQIA